ncbi:MAG: hypothetical protein ACKOC8_09360 [Pirellulales bacterium]
MSESMIRRRNRDTDITLHSATALATTLDMRDVAGAVLSIGTISTNASTLQMWVGASPSGSFRRLYKVDGSAADLTLAPSSTEGRAYSLPDEVFGTEYLKVVSATTNSTGTTGVVMLKS